MSPGAFFVRRQLVLPYLAGSGILIYEMPDQLSLSLWVKGFDADTMLRHFEELLRVFPFSRLRPGIGAVRVYAIEFVEPPVFERVYAEQADIDTAIAACREFEHDDCAYLVEGWWELFQQNGDWQLVPARVTLACFGPSFENQEGDHLRIDLGMDSHFLPRAEAPASERAIRSNVAGLVRLAHEIESSLPVERRRLWSESGENLAEQLEELL